MNQYYFNKNLILELNVSRASTYLSNIKRSSFAKDIANDNIQISELSVESGIDVPIFITKRFMLKNQPNQQHHDIDLFADQLF